MLSVFIALQLLVRLDRRERLLEVFRANRG